MKVLGQMLVVQINIVNNIPRNNFVIPSPWPVVDFTDFLVLGCGLQLYLPNVCFLFRNAHFL